MNSQSNPELYEEMNAPYDSPEEAQAALEAFAADVQEARKRHRIGNVAYVACAQDDKEHPWATYGHCGDSRYIVPLLTYALKTERDKYAAPLDRVDGMINEVLKKGEPD